MNFIQLQGRRGLTFPRLVSSPGLRHVFTLRQPDGSGNLSLSGGRDLAMASQERGQWCRSLGLEFTRLTVGGQVHGAQVMRVLEVDAGRGGQDPDGVFPATDALLTTVPDLPLLCTVGDCAAILLWAEAPHPGVLVAHGGWRGLVAGVLSASVRALTQATGSLPEDLRAGIAPCIGPTSFEVGADVADFAPSSCCHPWPEKQGKWAVDLEGWARHQLRRAGLREGWIEGAGMDTAADRDLFFSHRRQGPSAGRMGLLAGLTPGSLASTDSNPRSI